MATQSTMPMSTLFTFHKLNAGGIQRAEGIAIAFNDLLHQLHSLCEENREFSICKTKLEEAAFFAKKSMAVAGKNQEVR